MIPITPFVSQCCAALAEYSRLKAEGYSHADAMRLSKLTDAVVGYQPPTHDVKTAQAGKD